MNIVRFIALLVISVLILPSFAQEIKYEEPKVVKGSRITLAFRSIPGEDSGTVNGEYYVDPNDGTIFLPYLKDRVYVAGKTARQVSDLVRNLYVTQQIYAHPIVTATVGTAGFEDDLKNRYIQVTGNVGGKKNLPYRAGITLISALLECGDITDWGSRKIQVTRKGVTRTYDYFSAKDRAIILYPNDIIYVPKRSMWEARPDKIGP